MRIHYAHSSGLNNLRTDKAVPFEIRPEAKPLPTYKLDKINPVKLPTRSRLQKANQLIAQTLERRAQRVRAIAKAIQNNSYQIDSLKVADAIIANAILER